MALAMLGIVLLLVLIFVGWLLQDAVRRQPGRSWADAIKEWGQLLGSIVGLMSASLIFVAGQLAQQEAGASHREKVAGNVLSALMAENRVAADWVQEDLLLHLPAALVGSAKGGFQRGQCENVAEAFSTLATLRSAVFPKVPDSMFDLGQDKLVPLVKFNAWRQNLQNVLAEQKPILSCFDPSSATDKSCASAISDVVARASKDGKSEVKLPANCTLPEEFVAWILRLCVLSNRLLAAHAELQPQGRRPEDRATRMCNLSKWEEIRTALEAARPGH